MLAKDIKPGSVVNYENEPIIMESVMVQSPSARGAATLYKFRARNLITRQKIDVVFKGTDNLNEADFEKRAVKVMYADPTHMHFLDEEDYNQYTLERTMIEHEIPYLTESLEGVVGLIYNGECVGLKLPSSVALTIVECDPAIRGNSATARTKPAKLETGLVVHVPEHIKQGEVIKVSTETGEYQSRA